MHFDTAILLTNSFESALAAFLAGSKEIIGYRRDLRSFFLTHGVKTPSRKAPRMHQSDYYVQLIHEASTMSKDFVQEQGKDRFVLRKKVFFPIPSEVYESVDREWGDLGLDQSDYVIGFGPGASFGSAKQWPPDRFSKLGDRIIQKYGSRIIVFGGEEDRNGAEAIVDGMKEKALSLAGKTSLKSLGAMMEKCSLYITNDSGPMHIAAAVGIPIIAIFGSTDPSETHPLSDSYCIMQKDTDCAPCWKRECPDDHRCMDSISVEDVMDQVNKFISLT